jgi:hypothetical protein
MMSASSGVSVLTIAPPTASTSAILSESYSFIWHPNVRTNNFLGMGEKSAIEAHANCMWQSGQNRANRGRSKGRHRHGRDYSNKTKIHTKFVMALLCRDETYPKRSLRSRRKTADPIPQYRASLLGLVQKS